MIDLTRYGIVTEEFTWQAGEIANCQPPPNTRFRIRNRDLWILRLVPLENGACPRPAFFIYRTHPMTEDDILTHPYPDTTRPRSRPYVSP